MERFVAAFAAAAALLHAAEGDVHLNPVGYLTADF